MFTENANRIFNRSIEEYHRWDDVDHPIDNPYAPGTIDHLLYHKNWIDTVQWHLGGHYPRPGRSTPSEALAHQAPHRQVESGRVRTWWSTWTPTCWTNTRT